jgi:glucosylglycerate synthase
VVDTSAELLTQQRSVPPRTEAKLAEESFLTDDLIRQLINVGEVDILIGLPTHNNAKTIIPVLQAVQAGILKCFPRERAVIINADAGSRDGTPDLITGASIDDVRHAYKLHALRTLHAISTQYGSSPANGPAMRTILASADLLRAKACAVISPDSTNIDPEWIARLLHPVYKDKFDLVTPIHRRHKFEGLLMRQLVYPMTRAIYGWRVREPFASEYAFSGRLGSEFLAENRWDDEASRSGPEMLLTIRALTRGFRVCQTFLGAKATSDQGSADLVPAMRQTAGALFSSLEPNFGLWTGISASQPVPTIGPEWELTLEPLRVNRKRMREMFCSGVSELQSVFTSILTPQTLEQLRSVGACTEEQFDYSEELWVKTVYEFAAAYHKAVISRDHILQALVPLYRGRMYTFLTENRNTSAEIVELGVEKLCSEFERLKPYLLEIWNGGK